MSLVKSPLHQRYNGIQSGPLLLLLTSSVIQCSPDFERDGFWARNLVSSNGWGLGKGQIFYPKRHKSKHERCCWIHIFALCQSQWTSGCVQVPSGKWCVCISSDTRGSHPSAQSSLLWPYGRGQTLATAQSKPTAVWWWWGLCIAQGCRERTYRCVSAASAGMSISVFSEEPQTAAPLPVNKTRRSARAPETTSMTLDMVKVNVQFYSCSSTKPLTDNFSQMYTLVVSTEIKSLAHI